MTTTSKQLSDDVQELLLKCGYCFRERFIKVANGTKNKNGIPSNIGKSGIKIASKHDIYNINWLKLTEVEIDNSKVKKIKSFKEEWIDYDGMVYCVTVPNNIIYIRRNGKGCWCGNSLRWYDNGVPLKISDKYDKWLNKYEKLSEHTCIRCGSPDAKMRENSWVIPLCNKCEEDWRNGIW